MRTIPTAGDIVKFSNAKAAKRWYHTMDEQFIVEEGTKSEGYAILGHKSLSTEGYGMAWVNIDDLEIVEQVTDKTMVMLEEAQDYENW